LETTFSPLSFGKSFIHENQFSRSRERLSSIFVTDGKKQKKTGKKNRKKTSVKHIRIRLIGGCVNKTTNVPCQQRHQSTDVYRTDARIQEIGLQKKI